MIAAFAMATIRFARIAQGFPMEIPLLMNAASAMIIQKMIASRIAMASGAAML